MAITIQTGFPYPNKSDRYRYLDISHPFGLSLSAGPVSGRSHPFPNRLLSFACALIPDPAAAAACFLPRIPRIPPGTSSRQSPVAPVDISFKFPRFIFEFRYRTRKDGPKINEPFERRERLGSSHKDCTADMKPSLRTVCIRHQLPLTSESRSIGECRSAISDPADERTRTRSWPS